MAILSDSDGKRPPITELISWWALNNEINVWGVANLRGMETIRDESGRRFPFAVSWVIPMNPQVMADIRHGPNRAYADEYARVNTSINDSTQQLVKAFKSRGVPTAGLAASARTDKTNIKGDFPHKTAATRAGLGWIGRHCQLVTRQYGPWVRLGTVFINLELPFGQPKTRSYCGRCYRCVEACPAKALRGNDWYPGIPREDILDVHACDRWKKENYYEYHQGHNCGICSSVCPYGHKVLKRMNLE